MTTMSSGEEKRKWNVFEDVKRIYIAPEALMAEINSSISALEYARAATLLQPTNRSVSKTKTLTKS